MDSRNRLLDSKLEDKGLRQLAFPNSPISTMKETIPSPYQTEAETKYMVQVLTRRKARVSMEAVQTGVVDSVVACVCPCISIAQIASSTGLPYLLTLVGFGLNNLFNVMYMLKAVSISGTMLQHMDCGYLVLLKIMMFWLGPLNSLILVEFMCLLADDGGTILATTLPSVVLDFVFSCRAQVFRNKHDELLGESKASTCRVAVNTTCYVCCNLASSTARAKAHKGAAECDLGPMNGPLGQMDIVPPYQA